MKVGDKVRIAPHHVSDVLADNLANMDEGDITQARGDAIESLVQSNAVFVIAAVESGGFVLRPEKATWTIYGIHDENDLVLVARS